MHVINLNSIVALDSEVKKIDFIISSIITWEFLVPSQRERFNIGYVDDGFCYKFYDSL